MWRFLPCRTPKCQQLCLQKQRKDEIKINQPTKNPNLVSLGCGEQNQTQKTAPRSKRFRLEKTNQQTKTKTNKKQNLFQSIQKRIRSLIVFFRQQRSFSFKHPHLILPDPSLQFQLRRSDCGWKKKGKKPSKKQTLKLRIANLDPTTISRSKFDASASSSGAEPLLLRTKSCSPPFILTRTFKRCKSACKTK